MASVYDESSPESSGPDLHGDHGLLGAEGRKEVLLAQELKRELDQEATDLLQLLVGPGRVLSGQRRFGQVDLQLRQVPHVAGGQTPEHLERNQRSGLRLL